MLHLTHNKRNSSHRSGAIRRVSGARRRGTVLLLVVSLLSMLFVILTSFMALARFDRLTLEAGETSDLMDDAVDDSLSADTLLSLGPPADLQNVVDIPGSTTTPWLASLEPIVYDEDIVFEHLEPDSLDPDDPEYDRFAVFQIEQRLSDNPVQEMWSVRWPAVTALQGADVRSNVWAVELYRNSGLSATLNSDDALQLVVLPHGDADGDGVPDSSLLGSWALTSETNSKAQRWLSAPLSEPQRFPADDNNQNTEVSQTDRIDAVAYDALNASPYTVSARTISHGGMIDLSAIREDSPTREFTRRMLEWVRGEAPFNSYTSNDFVDLMDLLARQGPSVENTLRRRGGMVFDVPSQPSQTEVADAPPAFKQLLEVSRLGPLLFPEPSDNERKENSRFHLAKVDEMEAWRDAAALNADAYLESPAEADDAVERYNRRKLLTVHNTSDELSRRRGNGLSEGRAKFYLGDVYDAFDRDGYFIDGGDGTPNSGEAADLRQQVLDDLQDIYEDMLDGLTPHSSQPAVEEQALMLAVNTVAFAAPQQSDGWIDPVWVSDGNRRYYGYQPQPFITQVVTHKHRALISNWEDEAEKNGDDPEDIRANPGAEGFSAYFESGRALAVELYNPYRRDLTLRQYGLALRSDNFGPDVDTQTRTFPFVVNEAGGGGGQNQIPFNGLTIGAGQFVTIVIRESGNLELDGNARNDVNALGVNAIGALAASNPDAGTSWTNPLERDQFDVGLIRYTSSSGAGQSYLVDVVEDIDWLLDEHVATASLGPVGDSQDGWFVQHRCTHTEENESGFHATAAGAWRVITQAEGVFSQDDVVLSDDLTDPNDPNSFPIAGAGLGGFGPAFTGSIVPPLTRFVTGNPVLFGNERFFISNDPSDDPRDDVTRDVSLVRLNGLKRPISFPTVGFMLFMPRYAHVRVGAAAGAGFNFDASDSVSELLYDEWFARYRQGDWANDTALPLRNPPADFGHMPVFDARADATVSFDDGRAVPFGQLVFDYFTVIDPKGDDGVLNTEDDIDPRSIPGRINVNTAPWYVLAGLPMLSPDGLALDVENSQESTDPLSDRLPELFGDAEDDERALFRGADASDVPRITFDGLEDKNAPFDDIAEVDLSGSTDPTYRLGAFLGQAIVSYRDQVTYFHQGAPDDGSSDAQNPLRFANARNTRAADIDADEDRQIYRNVQFYDTTLQDPNTSGPLDRYGQIHNARGFQTLGELLNVKGFDQSRYQANSGWPIVLSGSSVALDEPRSVVDEGDYLKAIAPLVLLDTAFLTTRSHTFTSYVTILDQQNPSASTRAQITFDRSPMLNGASAPRRVASERGSYFNTSLN